eukprot:GHVL01039720.1.p1 GENE.GHVL01039720.1~~GHVL01039720.1.p1  ORF type:complete len:539 (+),score=91.75 GHVL01039720.1:1314-2930(+)
MGYDSELDKKNNIYEYDKNYNKNNLDDEIYTSVYNKRPIDNDSDIDNRLKNGIISPKNKDISPKNKDISPKNKDMSPKNKDISPKNKDEGLYDNEGSPKHKEINPDRKRETSLKNKEISPKNKDISPKNKDISQKNKDISQKNKDISPKNKDISPRNKDISPKNKDISPNNKDISPKNKDISPKNKDISPKNKDISPKNKDISQKNKDISPKNKDISPKNKETGTYFNSPKNNEIYPSIKVSSPDDMNNPIYEDNQNPNDRKHTNPIYNNNTPNKNDDNNEKIKKNKNSPNKELKKHTTHDKNNDPYESPAKSNPSWASSFTMTATPGSSKKVKRSQPRAKATIEKSLDSDNSPVWTKPIKNSPKNKLSFSSPIKSIRYSASTSASGNGLYNTYNRTNNQAGFYDIYEPAGGLQISRVGRESKYPEWRPWMMDEGSISLAHPSIGSSALFYDNEDDKETSESSDDEESIQVPIVTRYVMSNGFTNSKVPEQQPPQRVSKPPVMWTVPASDGRPKPPPEKNTKFHQQEALVGATRNDEC